MNSLKELHARVETETYAERLLEENTGSGAASGLMPAQQAPKVSSTNAGLDLDEALRVSLESAGYMLRYTTEGIFIVAQQSRGRALADLDELAGSLCRVVP